VNIQIIKLCAFFNEFYLNCPAEDKTTITTQFIVDQINGVYKYIEALFPETYGVIMKRMEEAIEKGNEVIQLWE
jgi:hypothetical protein